MHELLWKDRLRVINNTKLTNAMAGKVCAAPKNIPFGTQIKVSGAFNGTLTVVDRGGKVVG